MQAFSALNLLPLVTIIFVLYNHFIKQQDLKIALLFHFKPLKIKLKKLCGLAVNCTKYSDLSNTVEHTLSMIPICRLYSLCILCVAL